MDVLTCLKYTFSICLRQQGGTPLTAVNSQRTRCRSTLLLSVSISFIMEHLEEAFSSQVLVGVMSSSITEEVTAGVWIIFAFKDFCIVPDRFWTRFSPWWIQSAVSHQKKKWRPVKVSLYFLFLSDFIIHVPTHRCSSLQSTAFIYISLL